LSSASPRHPWHAACLAALLALAVSVPRATAAEGAANVRFEGNQALGEGRLRKEAVDELGDFDRRGHRRADADDAAYQMEQAYRREGFNFATVEYHIDDTGDPPTVTFTVDEGPQVRIDKVRFHGNQIYTDGELLAHLKGQRGGLFGSGALLFVESEVETGVSSLRDRYYRSGYIQVEVDDPVFTFSADRSRVTIDVTLREGIRHFVEALRFRGEVPTEAQEALDKLAATLRDQPYTRRRELDVRSAVLEAYGNLGFPDVLATVTDTAGSGPGATVLEVEIASGPRVTVSDVTVSGQSKSRERFIRSRAQLSPGRRYSQREVREAFRELYRTGIFTKVDIELEETEDPELRDLAIAVVEGPSRELWLEPGWGSYELLRLRAGAREKNLRGTGRIVRTEGGVSVKSRDVLVGFTDPWLLGSKVTADLPFTYLYRVEPSFTRVEKGLQLNFSRKLSSHVTATAGYSYSVTELRDVKVETAGSDAGDDYNLGSIGAQVAFDDRDDVFFPTAGQRIFLSGELADRALGGNVGFYRFTAGARWFRSLGSSTTLGLRYTTGLIIPRQGDPAMPLGERFFNGGGSTVRSFQESQLGPRDSSGEPVGGLGYNVANLELRQHLWGNWAGTLFVDYGNISPNGTLSEQDLSAYESHRQIRDDTLDQFFSDFRPGVGFGLLYLLPVGPARIDFAFNPDARVDKGERRFVWHFNVGMAF
jgi:outer membrane protein assembly complex protein YaeT